MSHILSYYNTTVTAGTPNPEYVVFLNGTERVIGPAKSLKVLPGDQVEMEAYAKYLHADSYDPSVAGSILLSGFMGAFMSASSEFLISNQYVDEGLLSGLQNITNGGQDYTGVPRAYLNYILFDKEYNVVEAKKLQISTEGAFYVGDTNLGTHEYLHIDPITISTEGYVYVYLSNQTPGSEVYFDDLLITHTQSRVIQKDDYYPFGLSISGLSASRENSLENRYLFNGKELQNNFDINLYDYQARYYDPSLGRFINVDPAAELMRRFSPFNYVFDNPIRFTDPDGMKPEDIIIKGSKEFQEQALADLQSLTDDVLELDKNGKVIITETSCNDGCKVGGNLVSDLINNEDATLTIEESSGDNFTDGGTESEANLKEDGSPGSGVKEVTVGYDPNKTTGGTNVNGSNDRPAEIGLGHELIHGKNRIEGKRDSKSSGVRDPDAPKGKGVILSNEELNTRKEENKLRKERGVPLRKTKQ